MREPSQSVNLSIRRLAWLSREFSQPGRNAQKKYCTLYSIIIHKNHHSLVDFLFAKDGLWSSAGAELRCWVETTTNTNLCLIVKFRFQERDLSFKDSVQLSYYFVHLTARYPSTSFAISAIICEVLENKVSEWYFPTMQIHFVWLAEVRPTDWLTEWLCNYSTKTETCEILRITIYRYTNDELNYYL